MADVAFIYDTDKGYSDIQVVGGDFLLTDTETINNQSELTFPKAITISGADPADGNGDASLTGVSTAGYPVYRTGAGALDANVEFLDITVTQKAWVISDNIGGNYDFRNDSQSRIVPKFGWYVANGTTAPSVSYDDSYNIDRISVFESSVQVAVEISLFTDRRATTDEIRRVQTGIQERQSRRGFWANDFKTYPQGSGLWLLNREKKTNETLSRAQSYCNDALDWMVREGIVLSTSTTSEFSGDALVLNVSIVKPDGQEAGFKYQFAWDALEVIQ